MDGMLEELNKTHFQGATKSWITALHGGKLHLLRLFFSREEKWKKNTHNLTLLNFGFIWYFCNFNSQNFFPKKSNESQRLLEKPLGKKYILFILNMSF